MVGEGGLGVPHLLEYLGKNKELPDAEVYAIYRALRTNGRSEAGSSYTIFSDTAPAGTICMGPEQRLAIATHEVGSRVTNRGNAVTLWCPTAH